MQNDAIRSRLTIYRLRISLENQIDAKKTETKPLYTIKPLRVD